MEANRYTVSEWSEDVALIRGFERYGYINGEKADTLVTRLEMLHRLCTAQGGPDDVADAERYRWLRNQGCMQNGNAENCYLDLNPRDMDAAIDAARDATGERS